MSGAYGREVIVRVARPGDVFGETRGAAPDFGAAARALEPSEVIEIPTAQLVTHLLREPVALAGFVDMAARRLAVRDETMCRLVCATALERLCLTLLDLTRDPGQDHVTEATISHYITQEELGRMTGSRREVVSGLLNLCAGDA